MRINNQPQVAQQRDRLSGSFHCGSRVVRLNESNEVSHVWIETTSSATFNEGIEYDDNSFVHDVRVTAPSGARAFNDAAGAQSNLVIERADIETSGLALELASNPSTIRESRIVSTGGTAVEAGQFTSIHVIEMEDVDVQAASHAFDLVSATLTVIGSRITSTFNLYNSFSDASSSHASTFTVGASTCITVGVPGFGTQDVCTNI